MTFKRLLRNLFRPKICFFSFAFLLGFYSVGFSPVTSAHEIPSFQVHSYELASGMKVYLKEDHSTPLVALALTVGVGSRTEGAWLGMGISHLLEHLVFRGTHQATPSEMAQKIERYGGEINAYTTPDFTLYYVSIPKEWVQVGLDVLFSSLSEPAFDRDTLRREKQVVVHEIRMGEDDLDRVLQKFFWKTAYRVHPYRIKTIGDEELLMKLTRKDILKFFRLMYSPENISLTLVGDFQSEEVLSQIKERFERLKRRPFSAPVVPQEPQMHQPRREELFKEAQLTRLMLGFHIPEFDHPDLIPLDVLSVMAGDGTQSRLYRRLQEDLRWTRQISTSTTSLLDPGMFVVSATLPDQELEGVEAEILKELERFRSEPVPLDELHRAKARILTDFYRQLDSIDRQAFWIGVISYLTGDPNYIQYYLKTVQAVSQEDIARVAQKYILPERRVVCVLRPLEGKSDVRGEWAGGHESQVSKVNFPNGMTLVIGEDPSVPLVSLQAVFKGGVICEGEGTNGLFQLMAATAIRGTSSKSSSEIFGPLEAVGGDLSSFSDQNTFGFSLKIPKNHFAESLTILAELIQGAAFPEGELEKQKDHSISQIQEIEESPVSWGFYELKKALFPGHPYRFLTYGSRESLHAISREDLLKTFRGFVRPDNLVLSIFGDVSREEVIREVKQAFQAWSRPEEVLDFPHRSIDLKGPVTLRQARPAEQSVMMVGFLGTTFQDPDRYGLELLAALFSGFGSPLFEKIRNELGAAYYVNAFNLFGLDPGAFIIYAGTTPEKEGEVLKAIDESLERVRQGRVDEEALLRAQNQLIGERLRDLQTLTAYAREAAYLELYGLGIEELKRYSSKIRALGIADLIRIAKKYFVDSRRVTLVVSPEKERAEE